MILKETAGDTLGGAINGSNQLFQTSLEFVPESVVMYVNGQRKLRLLDDGFTIPAQQVVRTKQVLLPGDTLEIEYRTTAPTGGGALGGIPDIATLENLPVLSDLGGPAPTAQPMNLEPRLSPGLVMPSVLARGLRPVILEARAAAEEAEEEVVVVFESEVTCQPSDLVGDWVYIAGQEVSGKYVVGKADPNDPTKIPAWGIIKEKTTSTTATVFWFGELTGLVTGLGLAAGERVIWLGTDGRTAQAPPGGGAYQQALGTVLDVDTILVEPDWEELPIPVYVSHFNTTDGSNDPRISDFGLTQRYIADPQGNHDIGDWTAGTQHGATQTSPVTYSTPAPFSILNDTGTIFTVTVYGADGTTPVATAQLTLTGNEVHTDAGITITITGWAADVNKYQASVAVSLNMPTILAAGGRFSVGMVHTNGSEGTFTYTQDDLFYDAESNAATLAGVTIVETAGQVVTRFLSGVEYYDLGSEFTLGIADIDNLNDQTYPLTQVEADGAEYGLPDLDLEGGDLTGWTNVWNQVNASYQNIAWAITQVDLTVRTTTGNVRARPMDWSAGGWANSPDAALLIETHDDTSTRLVERFYVEDWRCALAANFDAPAARGWTSNADLAAGDALFYDGGCGRNVDDWSPYNPNPGTQPDYGSQDATVYLVREFQHDGSASSGFTLNITGSYASIEYKLGAAWDGTPTGGTVWIDGAQAYNASQWNNGNPTGGTGGNTAPGRYTFGTNNIVNTSDTLYVRIGFTAGQRITGPLSVVFD